MQQNHFLRSGILAIVIVISFIICWELFIRSKGINIAYDDGPALWSDKRAMVKEPIDGSTVFIGSSRIKYDLDIDTWEKITGDHAIQLAIEGESPRPVLEDLANDKNFKGKLVVDVTEGLFFSSAPIINENPFIAFYKDRTPTQRVSFRLNHLLESKLVFLDEAYFSLNAILNKIPLPKREGVFSMPFNFPLEFGRITFDRQNIMMDKFLVDTTLQNQVTGLWLFFDQINTEPPVSGDSLQNVLHSIKNAVDKIKARGGQVVFVRTPSSGYYWPSEQKSFPREKYWNRLLSFTNCPGIHFKDYPAIAHFICPEWSHLSKPQAIVFTKNFIQILEQEKGWKFPNKKIDNKISY